MVRRNATDRTDIAEQGAVPVVFASHDALDAACRSDIVTSQTESEVFKGFFSSC
jgi:hypothetical protein